MTRVSLAALCVALLACLGLGASLWWQSGKLTDLSSENARLVRNAAVLSAQFDQARLSADVAAARAKRASQMSTEAARTVEEIRNLKLGECADATIDPDLANSLGRLLRLGQD